MKNIGLVLLFLLVTCYTFTSFAQASTIPQKKNFLIEKGTGHVCGSCPDIAKKCDTVINSHPRRGMLIEYHFGPDAKPQAGQLTRDFRTPYGDTIYEPTAWNWPFYLNMMVNRKDRGAPYGSTFIFGPNNNQVQPESDALINENAPVNLYIKPTYDASKRELTIEAEIYYTANAATPKNFLQIAITEDSIIGTQYDPANYSLNNGFNPNFNHTNVFRDNINGFFGDTIQTTTQGTLVKRTYKYTFPTMYRNIACNPYHCNLTMYIADQRNPSGVQSFTGRIMHALRTDITGKALTEVNVTETTSSISYINQPMRIYPNPTNNELNIVTDLKNKPNEILLINHMGQVVKSIQTVEELNTLHLSGLPAGLYLLQMHSADQVHTESIQISK